MAKGQAPVLPAIMGTGEVADALGVRVQNLQFIRDLPAPVAELKATRVWLAAEVLEFVKTYEDRRDLRAARTSPSPPAPEVVASIRAARDKRVDSVNVATRRRRKPRPSAASA